MTVDRLFSNLRERGIPVIRENFDEYLRDESRFIGTADGLVRVHDERGVVDLLTLANHWRVPLTVVSGKTSLTGSCVPLGGVIVDVRGLDFIDPRDPSRVGPGLVLRQYKDSLRGKGFFYPPDPTSEDSCTLGGTVACNASGALSFLYGPTREHIRGLKIALPFGSVLNVERGEVLSTGDSFIVPRTRLSPRLDRDLVIPRPRKGARPWRECKNAAGLYSADPMDLVDLFIGSEGILGIILEIRTILLPPRNPSFALLLSLPAREALVDLVLFLHHVRRWVRDGDAAAQPDKARAFKALTGEDFGSFPQRFGSLLPACLEWFGSSVTALFPPQRAERFTGAYGCLYVEQEYSPTEDPFAVASQWGELIQLINGFRESVSGRVEVEVALDEKQVRGWRNERKGVPEKLNEMIGPGMVKIGMDFAVPPSQLPWLMDLYDGMLPAGKSFVFGHIGNAHLHVNLVPESPEEAREFRTLYTTIAREVIDKGGSLSGEHGIGKLKHDALQMMLGGEGIVEIARIKQVLDPYSILNRNNMFRMGSRDVCNRIGST
ncbi:MAG: FAD-binding oxidoreductase [Desulfomonile tiedjei]|nr:FAD-binding oxidoreductase [Desulfomonile tiedjei]